MTKRDWALRFSTGHLLGLCYLRRARAEIRALRAQLAEAQRSSRNTLAIGRSIVRRSTRNCRSVADYADHLDGRITALSRVQTALSRDARGPLRPTR